MKEIPPLLELIEELYSQDIKQVVSIENIKKNSIRTLTKPVDEDLFVSV